MDIQTVYLPNPPMGVKRFSTLSPIADPLSVYSESHGITQDD